MNYEAYKIWIESIDKASPLSLYSDISNNRIGLNNRIGWQTFQTE